GSRLRRGTSASPRCRRLGAVRGRPARPACFRGEGARGPGRGARPPRVQRHRPQGHRGEAEGERNRVHAAPAGGRRNVADFLSRSLRREGGARFLARGVRTRGRVSLGSDSEKTTMDEQRRSFLKKTGTAGVVALAAGAAAPESSLAQGAGPGASPDSPAAPKRMTFVTLRSGDAYGLGVKTDLGILDVAKTAKFIRSPAPTTIDDLIR